MHSACVCKSSQSCEFVRRCPRGDRFARKIRSLTKSWSNPCSDKSCRGIDYNNVAQWAILARQDAADDRGVLGSCSTTKRLERCPTYAEFFRRHNEAPDAPALNLGDQCFPGKRNFV